MSVSRSPAPSSIDLSGVPARVAEAVAQVVAVCHDVNAGVKVHHWPA